MQQPEISIHPLIGRLRYYYLLVVEMVVKRGWFTTKKKRAYTSKSIHSFNKPTLETFQLLLAHQTSNKVKLQEPKFHKSH